MRRPLLSQWTSFVRCLEKFSLKVFTLFCGPPMGDPGDSEAVMDRTSGCYSHFSRSREKGELALMMKREVKETHKHLRSIKHLKAMW